MHPFIIDSALGCQTQGRPAGHPTSQQTVFCPENFCFMALFSTRSKMFYKTYLDTITIIFVSFKIKYNGFTKKYYKIKSKCNITYRPYPFPKEVINSSNFEKYLQFKIRRSSLEKILTISNIGL